MFNYFRDPGVLKNPRLHSMVLEAHELDKNYKKNTQSLIILLKKILSLAKAEKEWYLYLEAFQKVLFFEVNYGDESHTIRYSQAFFQDYTKYFEEAMAQHPEGDLPEDIVLSFDHIFDAYKLFIQIDDKKWDYFWKYFQDTVKRCGSDIFYWKSRLDFATLNRDKEMAQKAMKEYEKQPINYRIHCYACMKQVDIGYYLLIGDTTSAEKISSNILSKNIPKSAISMGVYERPCYYATLSGQYKNLLSLSVITGNLEAFAHFLPTYIEALQSSDDSEDTFDCYCKAAANDFSNLEEELKIAIEDVNNLKTFSGWDALQYMLCWMAYFKKLSKAGVSKIKISYPAANFLTTDKEGYYSTSSLSLWYEAKADELGNQFEKSRKQFSYQPLKDSYLACCGL